MKRGLDIAMFGSSLLSAYWNGAATYYRGILRALAGRGHRVRFYEPDAFGRQQHRDIEAPDWASVTVYAPDEDGVAACLEDAAGADVVVKASGVGVLDEWLEREVLSLQEPGTDVVFWDVDAPATLERIASDPEDPMRDRVPRYDGIFTYGGGSPVVEAYGRLGARHCVPIYNAVDPLTHFRVAPAARYEGLLGFLGNRLPDREQRVRDFFFGAAERLPTERFLLGGNGWGEGLAKPANVDVLGHVYTRDHNAFNSTPLAVMNIARDSMARFGFSPATRVFEAAGAGACIVTDAWEGLELFLEPGREVLVATSADDVAAHLESLTATRARQIGNAALARVLAKHTYAHRALEVESWIVGGRALAAAG